MSAVDTLLSRRTLLMGTLASVAGCSGRRQSSDDPDESALVAAREAELQIVLGTDGASPLREVHVAHLHALGGALPTRQPTPTAQPATTLVHDSVAQLQAAANAARRGANAALLASIAASHAAMSAPTA